MKYIVAISFMGLPIFSLAGTSNDLQSQYLYGVLGVVFIIILLANKIYSGLKMIYNSISKWIWLKWRQIQDSINSYKLENITGLFT